MHLVAVAAGWAYDAGLKSTAASVVPYAGVLRAAARVRRARAARFACPAVVAARRRARCSGAGAHFANVLPDLDDDAATGVRGLPHRWGAAGSRAAAALLLLAATIVLAVGAPVPPVLAAAVPVVAVVVLAAGFRAGRRPGSRAPFRAVLVVAGVAAVLLVVAGPAVVA